MAASNVHSLSKGDNKSFNIVTENISSTENKRSSIIDNDSKIKSKSTPSCVCNDRVLNTKFDIDIGYAIKLLKKEDQSINVYNHLQGILDKIISERPANPLENFEHYSQQLKRTYIREKDNFERVFLDSIDRRYCQKSLQMYKCALKKQSEKQKQYKINNSKSDKNPRNVKDENQKIVDNSHEVDVQVQNLFEVNLMFNKAGCGLPLDEVALISMSMNEMARLNKFKKIRFWGKIFGIKKTYFIIECEWTDAELNRKSLNGNLDTKSSLMDDDKTASAAVHVHSTKNNDSPEFISEKGSGFTAKKSLDAVRSIGTVIDGEVTGDEIDWNDSRTPFCKSNSYESVIPEVISPEAIGTGANRRVYFVANELNSKWIELDSVQPQEIVEARTIKRYFTGILNHPINTYQKFKGVELEYLRAQIARISSNTQICPRGYYVFNSAGSTIDYMPEENRPIASSNLTEKISFDLKLNKNYKPIPNKDLVNLNYWVHTNPQIDDTGISADHPNALTPPKWTEYSQSINDVSMNEEGEENEAIDENRSLNVSEELFGNLNNDIVIENKPLWKGVMCSPFNPRYSCTAMMSHIWPGACAVVDQFKTDFVYIGWAQKQDCSPYAQYSSKLISGFKMDVSTKESQTEFEEVKTVQKNQINELKPKLIINPSNEYNFEEVENEFIDDYGIAY